MQDQESISASDFIVSGRIRLHDFNQMLDKWPNLASHTYIVISYVPMWDEINVEWKFEQLGCQMSSCRSTVVVNAENKQCTPDDEPFSQRLSNSYKLDRCQPICSEFKSAPPPQLLWKNGTNKQQQLTNNLRDVFLPPNKCIALQAEYIESLVNPYESYDERWGLEDNGLDLVDEVVDSFGHFLPVAKVYDKHCEFFKTNFQKIENTRFVSDSKAKYYRIGSDNECGFDNVEHLVSMFTGSWFVRVMKDRHNVQTEAGRKISASNRHPTSIPEIQNKQIWKSTINSKKVKIPPSVSAEQLFSRSLLDRAKKEGRQLYWTNGNINNASSNTLNGPYNGLIQLGEKNSIDFDNAILLNAIANNRKRQNVVFDVVDDSNDNGETEKEKQNRLKDVLVQIRNYLNKGGNILGSMYTPQTAAYVAVDINTSKAMQLGVKKLLPTIESSANKFMQSNASANVLKLSSKLMSRAIAHGMLSSLASVVTKSLIGSLSGVGTVLFVMQLVDIVLLLIGDPTGLLKEPDNDAQYRTLANAYIRQNQRKFGVSEIEFTPDMLNELQMSNDDIETRKLTYSILYYNELFRHNVLSDGSRMDKILDIELNDYVDVNNRLTKNYFQAVQEYNAMQLIISPLDVYDYEKSVATKSAQLHRKIRWFIVLELMLFVLGLKFVHLYLLFSISEVLCLLFMGVYSFKYVYERDDDNRDD